MSLLNNLPLTKLKISAARFLYLVTKIFVRGDSHVINRGGITYRIDLTEGLDLSLFLFGNFQAHVSQNKYLNLPEDAVIFDVGANVGVMALQFAKAVPKGKVYAFEPTHYAYNKLLENIKLNPDLAERIEVVQTFVTSPEKVNSEIVAYSSWKVAGRSEDKHPVHLGTAMSTEGVESLFLDDFCEFKKIERLDFIKIDTDGHEPDVLNGAVKSIGRYKPKIIFETGLYVMEEKGLDFDFYYHFFSELNYKLYNSSNFKQIDIQNYKKIIPRKGTIDILALPY